MEDRALVEDERVNKTFKTIYHKLNNKDEKLLSKYIDENKLKFTDPNHFNSVEFAMIRFRTFDYENKKKVGMMLISNVVSSQKHDLVNILI